MYTHKPEQTSVKLNCPINTIRLNYRCKSISLVHERTTWKSYFHVNLRPLLKHAKDAKKKKEEEKRSENWKWKRPPLWEAKFLTRRSLSLEEKLFLKKCNIKRGESGRRTLWIRARSFLVDVPEDLLRFVEYSVYKKALSLSLSGQIMMHMGWQVDLFGPLGVNLACERQHC